MMSLKIPKSVGVIAHVRSPKCEEHVSWIKTAFGAEQLGIHRSSGGKRVMHCILAINDGLLYMCDFMEEFVQNQGDTPSGFLLHIDSPDAQALFDRAAENGASVVVKMEQQPCGNLYGCVKDPFGFVWGLMQAEEEEKKVPGVTPSLRHGKEKCAEHIHWLSLVFGAEVINKYTNNEDGSTCLSILGINGGQVQIAGETHPALNFLSSPPTNHLICHLEMDDPYPLWKKALENGSTVKFELKRQFWGGVYGSLVDKMGAEWSFSEKESPDSEYPVMGIYSYIVSTHCEKQIEWIQRVFEGGIKAMVRHAESKKVAHCEIAFSGGRVMICDAVCGPDQENCTSSQSAPESEGNVDAAAMTTPTVVVQCHCSDPDPIWSRAMAEGAIVVEELKRQYWGGYFGCFKDPYGVRWSVLKADECCGT